MNEEKFIFCLEAVSDVTHEIETQVVKNLEQLAYEGIDSIYKSCDTIESLDDSLKALLYDDHNFKNYEVIYLVMQGEANNICLNGYYYSMQEIAELFEGKLKGKILHFANSKPLDLDEEEEEAQYFLDITGAKAVSGYGIPYNGVSSVNLDKIFFSFFQDSDDVIDIVEALHEKHYTLCKLLDFRLYY